jgi:hypothetical protein
MITNTGKNILAKYLIGQASSYASHIALGCGPKPLPIDEDFEDYSNQKSLDFEMFRVPIISRGYITEDDISKIVFTAELPSENRYEITEVGVYSAGLNPLAGASDSKTIYAFNQNENWEHHTETLATSIPIVYAPLDGNDNNNIINQPYGVFQTNADNKIFTNSERIARYESCRFLNNIIAIAGNDADLGYVDNRIVINEGSNHIHLTGIALDFSKNSPTDELRLAFSVVSKDGESANAPDSVRVLLEFASTDQDESSLNEYAKFEVSIDNGTGVGQQDFEANRYVVVKKQIQELYKSPAFTWSSVNVVKIHASVIVDGEPSDDFYVCLDALRLENLTSLNSLYGLTGYSVVKSADAKTITKLSNTTNFIEFRFAMDVQ